MSRSCLPPRKDFTPIRLHPPAGACDAHAHVFGPYARYPLAKDRSYTPGEFLGQDFIAHLDRLGLTRGVLVTGSACGTDNGAILEALRTYPQRLRGVVVPSPDISDESLDRWHAAGIRAIRVNLFRMNGHAVYRNGIGLDALEKLAPRIAERGWHVQVWIHAPDLPELSPMLRRIGVPLVIDHMGRMSTAHGVNAPGFQHLCQLLADGVAWSKISGADRLSASGPPYQDVDPFAAALITANPDQVVWGSDWPHINYFDPKQMPDDGELFNLLARWLPSESLRQRVLVDNPARLYDFPVCKD